MLASMRAFEDAHPGDDVTIAGVYRDVGVPIGEAILAYAAQDYGRVVAIMRNARYRMTPLGGSWAQRDVWVRMLLHAALADGQDGLARVLLAERTDTNPTSGPSWKLYARALERCGAKDAAKAAAAKAATLLAA